MRSLPNKFLGIESRLNAICPYFTMFPLTFPLARLSRAQRNQQVLDPFCGRGTTNFAARLLGLASVGIDTNPVAVSIASAKLVAPAVDEVVTLCGKILGSRKIPDDIPNEPFWRWAFAPKTLIEICKLRDFFKREFGLNAKSELGGEKAFAPTVEFGAKFGSALAITFDGGSGVPSCGGACGGGCGGACGGAPGGGPVDTGPVAGMPIKADRVSGLSRKSRMPISCRHQLIGDAGGNPGRAPRREGVVHSIERPALVDRFRRHLFHVGGHEADSRARIALEVVGIDREAIEQCADLLDVFFQLRVGEHPEQAGAAGRGSRRVGHHLGRSKVSRKDATQT
jgi:hypothetical protein